MSIERAEQLKRELTDRYVTVAAGVPELRRFGELTGRVRTVNMNCRALVEFDGAADIGWYDIDPQYLTVVAAPESGASDQAAAASAESAAAKPESTPVPSGASPLDQIRAQAAGGDPDTGLASKPPAVSPLDQIRRSAGGSAALPASPEKAVPAESTSGMSPLDQIRASSGGPAGAVQPQKPDSDSQPARSPAPAEESDTAEISKDAGEDSIPGENLFSVMPRSVPDYGTGDGTPTIFDQIYQQAGLSVPRNSPAAPNVFQQVRAQAESDS